MKAQIRLDFIFGIVIFVVVIFFVSTQLSNILQIVLTDANLDNLKAKAIGAITILSESPGDPTNWESLQYVNRVGLADRPYFLNLNKVTKLNSDCSLLDNMNLFPYRLTVYDSTSRILICGSGSLKPPLVTVTRTIIINNQYGNITLEMY